MKNPFSTKTIDSIVVGIVKQIAELDAFAEKAAAQARAAEDEAFRQGLIADQHINDHARASAISRKMLDLISA